MIEIVENINPKGSLTPFFFLTKGSLTLNCMMEYMIILFDSGK